MKKLSILICTIVGREELLDRLLNLLERQMKKQVEILVEKDNKKMTIGAKRNILLEKARGDYICFIDDDDIVSENYIYKIMQALKTNPDCCSLKGTIIRRKGANVFLHSIRYRTWFARKGIYYRCPNHLNTVKRELALQIGFPDRSAGEDMTYSQKLLPLLKEEAYIKESIYLYLAN